MTVRRTEGFTLIEVLVAVAILAVITALIYASFAAVVDSVEAARMTAEELRTRQFLARVLVTDLSTVYLYRGHAESDEAMLYAFFGEDGEGGEGPADRLMFCSTAPLAGGMALPGDIKQVTVELDDPSSDMTLDLDGDSDQGRDVSTLVATEMPVLGGLVEEADGVTGEFMTDVTFEGAAEWEIPGIRTLDIKYFDGEDWVDDWDSYELGRLPWCVHLVLNFVKSEEDRDSDRTEGMDIHDDPDLEMYIPLPTGMALTEYSVPIPELLMGEVVSQQGATGAATEEGALVEPEQDDDDRRGKR